MNFAAWSQHSSPTETSALRNLSSPGTKCGDDAVVVGTVNRTAESNEKAPFVKITLDSNKRASPRPVFTITSSASVYVSK